MSQEAEKIKKLVAFKKKIEKKVEELESELNELRLMLEVVNSTLLEKGFKRAEIAKVPTAIEALPPEEEAIAQPSPQPPAEYENTIPLKTVTGELLANLYVSEDSLRVVLAEDKNFNINTPPFTQFLIERVLVKMQEKDNELARTGQMTQDKIFSYNIVREGDVVHEIQIRNFDADRLRELKSSIRWTLEKMDEKMKS
ncbi:MAG: hypothetical protein OEZ21_11290 [Candidatus Bathyarchaeota archaeon]|nr:hypothetical protein [Candidatus Bathyarchaeota archaeon]MDH5747515.1 hypothetical protein [Candidatus Bathyarchaeota archaeon]